MSGLKPTVVMLSDEGVHCAQDVYVPGVEDEAFRELARACMGIHSGFNKSAQAEEIWAYTCSQPHSAAFRDLFSAGCLQQSCGGSCWGRQSALDTAANILHKSRTDFILEMACQAAENVILDRRMFNHQ